MFSPDTRGQLSKGRQNLQAAPIWPWRKAYSAWKENCELDAQQLNEEKTYAMKQVANDVAKTRL
jgi:hypothetical protein